MKVVQLHEYTQKQLLNPTPTPKLAHWGPKRTKITFKIKSNSYVRIYEIIKYESCSTMS